MNYSGKKGYTLNFHYKTQPFIIKICSASGGLRPLTTLPGALSFDQWGSGGQSHYRLALRARHMAHPFQNSWIRQ